MQKESISALSGLHLAELTVTTYQKMQSDEEAELFFKTVSKKALDYPFINNAALPRKRKRPNYGSLDNYFQVEGYGNSTNTSLILSYHQLKIVSINLPSRLPQNGAASAKHSRQ